VVRNTLWYYHRIATGSRSQLRPPPSPSSVMERSAAVDRIFSMAIMIHERPWVRRTKFGRYLVGVTLSDEDVVAYCPCRIYDTSYKFCSCRIAQTTLIHSLCRPDLWSQPYRPSFCCVDLLALYLEWEASTIRDCWPAFKNRLQPEITWLLPDLQAPLFHFVVSTS